MAASETVAIERLAVTDVEGGVALSTEAGWNQTEEDWRHFIDHGHAFGVRDPSGRLVASAAALPYDGPFGFVSMVLVTPDWRRKGLATTLVDRCVDVLQARGLVPVLDATAAGAQVYGRQGFVGQFGFDRWQGSIDSDATVAAVSAADIPVAALDAAASGAGRAGLMADFQVRAGTRVVGDAGGFAMIRTGRRARQAGPVVADSEDRALDLVGQLFTAAHGSVFIDVPSAWHRIGAWLRGRGFEIQRSFTRMALGRSEPFGRPDRLFAVAGPEFG